MDDNEAIARYVMEWQMEGHFLQVWWEDEKHRSQIRAVDWHPDTNQSQAMQVAEAMRTRLGHSYKTAAYSEHAANAFRNKHGFWLTDRPAMFAWADTLESAIHAVAVQVARMMEAGLTAKTDKEGVDATS